MARMLVLDDQPAPPPESIAFWRAAGMPPDLLAQRATERPFNFSDCVHPIPPGYRRIVEGEVGDARHLVEAFRQPGNLVVAADRHGGGAAFAQPLHRRRALPAR